MYQYHTLNNGIRIIFKQRASAVIYSGVHINVGSRDEEGANEGIAHFIEHSIFKGTENRRSYHIRNRIDGVGGELDAFTTKEDTCIYASALTEHLERCLELFADMLFHATFPSNEIEKEKDVVIEEINLYKDDHSESICVDFENSFFGNHPLAHDILGTKKNVKHFTSEILKDYLNRKYTPDRMVISVVGNVEFKKLVRLCQKYFEDYPSRTADIQRTAPPIYTPFNTSINKRGHQTLMVIGCPAPNTFDDNKTAFTLLNNILGGSAMNSRLNVAIREKHGFCYNIYSSYYTFTDAGISFTYAGVDNGAAERSTELILNEMKRLRDTRLTSQQLKAAQMQFIGNLAIDYDSGQAVMEGIGKAHLNFDHVDTLEENIRDILSVTAEDIQSVAQEYLVEDKLSFMYYK